MTRLLVLGGGRHQAPLIRRAEERGIEAVVVDYLVDSPGHRIASHSQVADATDPELAAQIAETFQVDGVVTTGTDIPIRAMAAVADKLGAPCYVDTATARMATDKQAMHTALSSAGVAMARWVVVDEGVTLGWTPMPAVVKPADSQGQRGVTSVLKISDLPKAIDNARSVSRSGRVIVEEFLEGPEFTANAWVQDGEIRLLMVNDRITFNPRPYLGIAYQHRYPSQAATSIIDPVRDITQRTAKAYRIDTGPLYIQMIRTGTGPMVVEAAARIGGGHESRMMLHLTGWSSDDALIDLALGQPPIPPLPLPEDSHALVNFILGRRGKVGTVEPFLPGDGIIESEWYVNRGDLLKDVTDSLGRIGYFLADGSTADDLMDKATAYYAALDLRSDEGMNLVRIPERESLNLP